LIYATTVAVPRHAGTRLPVENLLPPDALRRLAWEPPSPATRETVAAALASSGARPWQADLTAGPLAEAFAVAAEASSAVDLDLPPGTGGT